MLLYRNDAPCECGSIINGTQLGKGSKRKESVSELRFKFYFLINVFSLFVLAGLLATKGKNYNAGEHKFFQK